MEGGAEGGEVTPAAGADGKSFSHVCKESVAWQVGEVSSRNFTEGKTRSSSELLYVKNARTARSSDKTNEEAS